MTDNYNKIIDYLNGDGPMIEELDKITLKKTMSLLENDPVISARMDELRNTKPEAPWWKKLLRRLGL